MTDGTEGAVGSGVSGSSSCSFAIMESERPQPSLGGAIMEVWRQDMDTERWRGVGLRQVALSVAGSSGWSMVWDGATWESLAFISAGAPARLEKGAKSRAG